MEIDRAKIANSETVCGQSDSAAGLQYTGHPLIDVGTAAITALRGRHRVADVSKDDLRATAAFLDTQYSQEPFRTVIYSTFPNSAYINANMSEESRQRSKEQYLYSFERAAVVDLPCALCGRPGSTMVFREYLPLVSARGDINFGPGGRPGVPLCGVCLLCIQALPVGCDRCEGRLLLAHSDDNDLTFQLTRACVQANLRALSLTSTGDPGSGGLERKYPRTLLLQRLLRVGQRRSETAEDGRHPSLTAYHLTNYGTGADVRMYVLPSRVLDFVQASQWANYKPAWQAIASRSWVVPEARTARRKEASSPSPPTPTVEPEPGSARNSLYDAIFSLPDEASRFVRRFLLRRGRDASEGVAVSIDLLSWPLTTLFLEIVLDMEKERIARIRQLGDRLARLVDAQNDRQLFRDFYRLQDYHQLRNVLIKAELAAVRRSDAPVITFDDFISIFEDSEDFPRLDWRLARDLVLIRLLEQLREQQWFSKNTAVLVAIQEAEQATEDSQMASNGAGIGE